MEKRKDVIAVVGASGAQGSGLVRAILQDPRRRFAARAITRDPASPGARRLAAEGAEVVAADLDDAASLRRAFEGAAGAFCVTFFWAHLSPERELAHARALATASRDARVPHVIWSTLEDTRAWLAPADDRMPTFPGGWRVPHFDAKGAADAFFREADVPVTFLRTSFYWDNFVHFGMGPRPAADGTLVLALPMGERKLPGIAAEDIGPCALALLSRGREVIGQTVGIAGEHLTGAEMAAGLGAALGRTVRYQAVPFDAYRALGFPGATDLGNMFQLNHDFERDYCAARPVAAARALHPGLLTFAGWLARHVREIPLV
jgi:uncharacterized protein YbjT (DUF2867 family)